MRRVGLASSVVMGVLGGLCGAADAQTGGSILDRAFRVDQGLSDQGPLGTSLRAIDPGLRRVGGFGELLQLPTSDGRDVFARRSGGITAVFERSVYVGPFATIPPGTTFVIGEVPDWFAARYGLAEEASPEVQARRLDYRIEPGLGLESLEPVNRVNRAKPTMRRDRYRRSIEELLREAVRRSDGTPKAPSDGGAGETRR
ncbi:MAG: hypothetical protein AAFR38_12830 [Planctomycetota bacterium]